MIRRSDLASIDRVYRRACCAWYECAFVFELAGLSTGLSGTCGKNCDKGFASHSVVNGNVQTRNEGIQILNSRRRPKHPHTYLGMAPSLNCCCLNFTIVQVLIAETRLA